MTFSYLCTLSACLTEKNCISLHGKAVELHLATVFSPANPPLPENWPLKSKEIWFLLKCNLRWCFLSQNGTNSSNFVMRRCTLVWNKLRNEAFPKGVMQNMGSNNSAVLIHECYCTKKDKTVLHAEQTVLNVFINTWLRQQAQRM